MPNSSTPFCGLEPYVVRNALFFCASNTLTTTLGFFVYKTTLKFFNSDEPTLPTPLYHEAQHMFHELAPYLLKTTTYALEGSFTFLVLLLARERCMQTRAIVQNEDPDIVIGFGVIFSLLTPIVGALENGHSPPPAIALAGVTGVACIAGMILSVYAANYVLNGTTYVLDRLSHASSPALAWGITATRNGFTHAYQQYILGAGHGDPAATRNEPVLGSEQFNLSA